MPAHAEFETVGPLGQGNKGEINAHQAETEAEVIRLRSQLRMRPPTIAQNMGLSVLSVNTIIKNYVAKVRAGITELIEQRAVEQDETIEYLLAEVLKVLAKGYDKDAIKCAIMLLERQAKLHGFDKASVKAGMHDKDWIEEASDAELVDYAKTMGLRLPESFALAG